MTLKQPTAAPADADAIRAQVLRGIAGNRLAGLHFAGYFLEMDEPRVAGETVSMPLGDGPHCRNADGELDITTLCLLADSSLATATRCRMTPGARLATLHLAMQFTGVPAIGRVHSDAHFLDAADGTAVPQLLSAATVFADGRVVCHASGEFGALNPPPGVSLAPLPWEQAASQASQLPATADIKSLDAHERAILKACNTALARTASGASFIQHFWGGLPRRNTRGTSIRFAVGPHLGNRVGHVQGGISVGIAVRCASAAAPAHMMLSNVSAWYISPGRGKALGVRSRVVHAGRTIAVVRTEVRTTAGDLVLEVVTHHVARSR